MAALAVQSLNVPGGRVQVLDAIGALPAHITGRFQDPIAWVEASSGESLVLDRRTHRVYGVDRARTRVRTVLEIGGEGGKLLRPAALSLAPQDVFAIADAPTGQERLQYFTLAGQFINGVYLATRSAPRLTIGSLVLNGVGSLQFTGSAFFVSHPEQGALISELDLQGHPVRQFGHLRPTGQERDRDVHLALNLGMPLIDPTGGFYFVFRTGRPMFRKYSDRGDLLFERHIEGPHLDATIQTLPTVWPRRDDGERLPLVEPTIRTAAVDGRGRLWVSLIEPFTYVYDATGEKTRTLQFRGADVIAPASLFFAKDRVLVTPGCYEFRID